MNPENELGVIVLFAQQMDTIELEFVSIQANFPDAILKHGNVVYRAEFEFRASGFKDHKHDARRCDLIICWENDFPDSVLPVLALSESDWQLTDLTLPSEAQREAAYWKQRALLAENRLRRSKSTIFRGELVNENGRMKPGALDDPARVILKQEPDIGPRPLARALSEAVGTEVHPSTASGILRRLKREMSDNGTGK